MKVTLAKLVRLSEDREGWCYRYVDVEVIPTQFALVCGEDPEEVEEVIFHVDSGVTYVRLEATCWSDREVASQLHDDAAEIESQWLYHIEWFKEVELTSQHQWPRWYRGFKEITDGS